PKDVGPEYYVKDPQLGVGPGKPRTLNPKETEAGICRTPPGTFIQDIPSLFQVWSSRKVVDDTMPQDFKNKYPNTQIPGLL
ncbi:hypothetical protein P5673_030242, partial [Acropora cervicornis]